MISEGSCYTEECLKSSFDISYILKYVKIDLKSNNNNKNIGNTLLKTFMYNVL